MKVLALFRRPETRRMDKGMDKGMEKERGPGRRPVEGDCGCHGFGRFLHIMKNDVYVGVGQVVSISKEKDGACVNVKVLGFGSAQFPALPEAN